MIAVHRRGDHGGGTVGIQPGKQYGGLDLCARDGHAVFDAVKRGGSARHHRRGAVVGLHLRTHFAQRLCNPFHGAFHQRGVADQARFKALRAQQSGKQAHGGAGIAHVQFARRRVQAALPNAVNQHMGCGALLDINAKRPHGSQRRQAIFAGQESFDLAQALGDARQHQRTVRNRLIAGYRQRTAYARGSALLGNSTLENRPRVGTQNLVQRCALLQHRQRGGHGRVAHVAFDIDEEHIVPFALARGARLDARHADPMFRKRLEQPKQRAGIIGAAGGHQQSGAVRAAGAEQLSADHQEARGVVGAILDLIGKQIEAVDLGGRTSGYRRRTAFVARTPRSFGVARHRNTLDVRQMLVQPSPALRQRLRVRADALDLSKPFILPIR